MSNPIYDLFIRYATDGPSSEMSLPEFSEAVAEARADQRRKDCAAVCGACPGGQYAERWQPAYREIRGTWLHLQIGHSRPMHFSACICGAAAIHELHRQETQSKVS